MEAEQAFLFLAGALASLLSAMIAGRLVRVRGVKPLAQPDMVARKNAATAGWVYYGAAPLRLLALLLGCTLVYLMAAPGAGRLIVAYALGLAAAWLVHVVVALVKLRE